MPDILKDSRNVLDKYKYWSNILIRQDLEAKQLPYSVCMLNLNYDYNFASVLRNANAFGARRVYYVSDKKKYDPRGAVGAQYVTDVIHLQNVEELEAIIDQGYHYPIAIETIKESRPIQELIFKLGYQITNNKNLRPLLIFGSECMDIPKSILDKSLVLKIPMWGSVRSINVACASAIAMYALTTLLYYGSGRYPTNL